MNLPVRRDPTHAVLTGVCAGVARRWGIDPQLVRIAVVILGFSSGVGVILYGAAMALMPPEGSDTPPIQRWIPAMAKLSPIAVIAVVGGAAVVGFGLLGGLSGLTIFPALLILAIWHFRFRGRKIDAPARTSDYERAAQAWRQRLLDHRASLGLTAHLPAVPQSSQPAAPVPVAPRSPGRRVSPWLLCAALLLLGGGGLVIGLPLVASLTHLLLAGLGVTLLALGISLITGSFRGRARAMAPVTGILLLAAAALLTLQALGVTR